MNCGESKRTRFARQPSPPISRSTPPEILKRATFDCARDLGQDQRLGSIEKGKLADFFLIPGDPTKELKAIKTIRMVVKNGIFYYRSEVYPKFEIKPFAGTPAVKPAVQ